LQHRWSLETIAEDFRSFLAGFIKKYPTYADRDIYLTGESYAGHYIPVMANRLHYAPVAGIRLAGIALGNAWVDPFYQHAAYPSFAVESGLIDYGHYFVLGAMYTVCQMALIVEVPLISTIVCEFAGISIAPPLPKFNIYDIRQPCETFIFCYPDDKFD